MKYLLKFIVLVIMLTGCSTAQLIDIGEGDASVTLGQIDAEANGIPGGGASVELDGCTLILRNLDTLVQDGASSDEVLNSIKMKTPTCSFGEVED